MVLVDLGADHAVNRARAVELGIARTFKCHAVNGSSLRDAVDAIPTDRSRARARWLSPTPPAGAVVVLRQYIQQHGDA